MDNVFKVIMEKESYFDAQRSMPNERQITPGNSRWIVFSGLLIWLGGIFSAPLLAGSADPLLLRLSSFFYFFYQPVCHQLAERSFLMDGFALAVCVRCLAFYLGGLFISLFYLFKAKIGLWPLSVYILLAAPAVFDFLIEKIFVYDNTGSIRFISGLLLGVALFHLLILSLARTKSVYTNPKTRYQKV